MTQTGIISEEDEKSVPPSRLGMAYNVISPVSASDVLPVVNWNEM